MLLKIKRNSFYDPNNQRIDVLDSRYYFKKDDPDTYYPSVTTVLEALPKGWALTQWHKSLGFNADIVLAKAAETGSNVHGAIEKYLLGNRIVFGSVDEFGNFKENYTLEEWLMILKFVDFWTTYKPKLIATEVRLVSDVYKLGGTIDIICEINGENWIIDAKSGNSIYDSHEFQVAAYAVMWNEVNPDYPIHRCGVLHLKALTRGADKTKAKKIQGAGWQVKEFDRHYGDAFKIFKNIRAVWDEQNPEYKPANESYPSFVELPDDLKQQIDQSSTPLAGEQTEPTN